MDFCRRRPNLTHPESQGSNGDREYVARIPALQILTNEEAADAWAKLRALGYVEQMADEVVKVDGDVERFRAAKGHEAVNVRFLPDEVEYDERFARPVSRTDGLHKLPGHYVLYEYDPKKYGDLTWNRGEIPLALRRTGAVSRSGSGPTIADDAHNRHQNALMIRLAQIYGAGAVVPEATAGRGRADIEIRDAGARIIFEVKPDLDPGAAIRSAVGQLLEYAVWPPAHGAKDRLRLVIAAPAEETQASRMYLEALRSKFRVPVEYVQTFEEPARIQWRR